MSHSTLHVDLGVFLKSLSEVDKLALWKILDEEFSKESSSIEDSNSNNSLKELLLKGPVMTDEQYGEYLENRKDFDEWLEKTY